MAQKKLLFFLMVIMFCSMNVQAIKKCKEKEGDLEFAQSLAKKSRQKTILKMQEKWLELQKMLGNYGSDNKINANLASDFVEPDWGVSLRIFVSSSMGKNLLRSYAKAAKKYNATLVFNGLPDGSWIKLSDLVTEISSNNPELVAMQIDDQAFVEFNIKRVPSFVLSKEEDVFVENPKVTFDKITGSIGIRKALEVFQESGQLHEIASNKLAQED